MIGALTNHLWQSTLFAVVAGLLTIAFRRNRAQVRYCLWLSASLKFFLPFSLLISLGSHLQWAPAARRIAAPAVSFTMVQITQPFSNDVSFVPSTPSSTNWVLIVILGIWACGFAAIALIRLRGWRRIRATVRSGAPTQIPAFRIPANIEVRSSPGLLEPGVVGFLRPILLLPAGITARLTPPQLEAVLVHERCHVRRRDNLTSAIHMIAEAIFWFHPLVWWIGARLVEERERACDEEVLRLVSEPQIYAEGILNVCKLYVESPLVCVSGVTGADLKKRIHAIMTNRDAVDLNFRKKLALAVAGIAALAVPIVAGMMNAPSVLAQSVPAATLKFEVASIKPNAGGVPGTNIRLSPGGLNVRNYTPRLLIETAYRVQSFQIIGVPGWIDSDRYDIIAKADGNPTSEQVAGPMLQALLENRFKLKLRRETKELPVYALTVAKNGFKLQKSNCEPFDFNNPPPPPGPGEKLPYVCSSVTEGGSALNWTLDALGMSLTELVRNLSLRLDRTVIDKTGIKGIFDVHLEYSRELAAGGLGVPGDSAPAVDTASSTIFTALQEQLGLKLESGKGPVEVLVIDHIERPSEN